MQLDKKSGRKRRDAKIGLEGFMDSIKEDLGEDAFETFMSVQGEVTLMFAIDTTGSMSDLIEAAKDIATSIIDHEREEKVDFILSPFGDPGIVFPAFIIMMVAAFISLEHSSNFSVSFHGHVPNQTSCRSIITLVKLCFLVNLKCNTNQINEKRYVVYPPSFRFTTTGNLLID